MLESSMIIEGFICPECQQDMSSVELLQAHFELVHSTKNLNSKRSNNTHNQNGSNLNGASSNETSTGSGFSSVLAKAKTLISFDQTSNDQSNDSSDLPSSVPNKTSSNSQGLNNQVANSNNNNSNNNASNSSAVSNKFMKQYFNSNQNNGYFQSHTNEFKKMRDNTIGRYVIQTNKLLITLDRLISFDLDTCTDDSKREMHYKSIVTWVSDRDVQLCPNCAKSFNLMNRKHHCRLCGAIMCNKCSQFISFTQAKQLTDPDSLVKAHTHSQQSGDNEIEFKLKRSNSITSVNSYFFNQTTSTSKQDKLNKSKGSLNTDQIYLRLCFDCGLLLEKNIKI